MKKDSKFVISLIVILLLSFFISKYLYQFMLIQGNSMYPSYHDLQLVVIKKYNNDYSYNDVVAIDSKGLNTVIVKRIVGCPGDTVIIEDKHLYVNNNRYNDITFEYAGVLEKEIKLKEGEYIVIGDNISESKDSRYEEVGIIGKDSIIGVVLGSK